MPATPAPQQFRFNQLWKWYEEHDQLPISRGRETELSLNEPGYDLVGDIHGHADPLHRLLDKLGMPRSKVFFGIPNEK